MGETPRSSRAEPKPHCCAVQGVHSNNGAIFFMQPNDGPKRDGGKDKGAGKYAILVGQFTVKKGSTMVAAGNFQGTRSSGTGKWSHHVQFKN